MKSLLSHACAFAVGVVLTSALALFACAMKDVGETMQDWADPVVLSDSAVRERISDLGIAVPELSKDLYIFHTGWQDHAAFVGMTLVGNSSWDEIRAATGFAQSEFELAKPGNVQGPSYFGKEHATPDWELRETVPLFVATKQDGTGGRLAYFDSNTRRLLVHDWSN